MALSGRQGDDFLKKAGIDIVAVGECLIDFVSS
jgi:hypothetical protein